MTNSFSVVTTLAAVIFGGIEFGAANHGPLGKQIGVCYYLQVRILYLKKTIIIIQA